MVCMTSHCLDWAPLIDAVFRVENLRINSLSILVRYCVIVGIDILVRCVPLPHRPFVCDPTPPVRLRSHTTHRDRLRLSSHAPLTHVHKQKKKKDAQRSDARAKSGKKLGANTYKSAENSMSLFASKKAKRNYVIQIQCVD